MNNLLKNHEYFLTIASVRNITKAAKILYVSQPALTQYLKRLETNLGTPLFDRNKNPLTLTPAGEVYLTYINKVKELNNQLWVDLDRLQTSEGRGKLTIGVPLQLQMMKPVEIVPRFLRDNPQIDIAFSEATSPVLEKMAATRLIDAAFVHVVKPFYENLHYVPLRKDRVVLVCSKHHPLVRGREATLERPLQVSLRDLSEEAFYLMEPESLLRQAADEQFRRYAFRPKRAITLANSGAAMNLARNGDGVAFSMASLVELYAEADSLAMLNLDGNLPVCDFSLIYPKGALLPPLRQFIDYFNAHSGLTAG